MRPVSFTPDNRVTLLHCGEEFFPSLVAAINDASDEIYLETYIFADDQSGLKVREALREAVGRGVLVHVIADWTGTGRVHIDILRRELAKDGVHLRVFNPWFRRGIARSHRKLCVVDKRIAFVGGINIIDDMQADDDSQIRLPYPRWDFAVRIEGPLVAVIHLEMEAQWFRLGSLKLRSRWELFRDKRPPVMPSGSAPILAAFVMRDNLRNRRTIQRAYLQALGHARKRVVFANPYFAPGRKMRQALVQAASRGVDVTLLLGVGQFKFQDAVAHSFYPKLLKAGVRLVEYRKTQLHAKVAVVDDNWATIGSSNYDGLSLFVNQEANVVIRDVEFCNNLRAQIESGMAEGIPVDYADYENIPWFKRGFYGVAFFIYETVIRVVTWSKYV